MMQHGGIGLAANQVQVGDKPKEPRRIMICWDGKPTSKILVMCNPVLISENTPLKGLEGCLSFPNMWLEVMRSRYIKVRYIDVRGKFHTIEAEGILARCILHELDHLNGVVFTDYEGEEDGDSTDG